MRVRCKMKVTAVTHRTSSYYSDQLHESSEVELSPVQGQENQTWAKYTPSGKVSLTINNPAALAAFVVGQTYFVDFTEAPAKEADEK